MSSTEAAQLTINIVRHNSKITTLERAQRFGQVPVTVWFTGLSGAGKSTLAFDLDEALSKQGNASYVLDGDNVRHGLNRDLGFSPEDRTENIRRIAEVARLMNEAGLIVLTSFISPYRADRELARQIIGPDQFLEVHVSTTLAVCEARDPKALYQKARRGEIAEFTGISAPYEVPVTPALAIDTGNVAPSLACASLIQLLQPFLANK
jgi:adenylylsulfate kinase